MNLHERIEELELELANANRKLRAWKARVEAADAIVAQNERMEAILEASHRRNEILKRRLTEAGLK